MIEENGVKKEEEEKKGPAWMVTFSDLSTLLLTFFVLLLSMSTMDDMTLKSLFHNFTCSSGILYFKEYGEIYRPKEVLIQSIYQKLKDSLVVRRADDPAEDIVSIKEEKAFKELGSSLRVEDLDDGFKLVFGHQLLFASGSAEISEDMKPLLARIARFMKTSTYQIYIDGHTDDVPITRGKYPSNEVLSMARAFNLMNYFVKEERISPGIMAIAGYGEYNPVAANDTPSGRERNRRVEIIFKNQTYF